MKFVEVPVTAFCVAVIAVVWASYSVTLAVVTPLVNGYVPKKPLPV